MKITIGSLFRKRDKISRQIASLSRFAEIPEYAARISVLDGKEEFYADAINSLHTEINRSDIKDLLSDFEINAINNGISDLKSNSVSRFSWESDIVRFLKELWNPELKIQREKEEAERKAKEEEWAKAHPGDRGIRFSKGRRIPQWYIGLTGEFNKAISKIDKKLQGRILEAITDIVNDPLSQIGNTLKPLRGNKKGLWRYRIGNYRLIYQPDQISKHVLLLTVLPRGSAYE